MRRYRIILWTTLLVLYVAVAWIAGIAVLVIVVALTALLVWRLGRALAPTIRCPRGHEIPTYGRYTCSVCGAETLSSAWRCRWCRSSYAHVRCPTCGLSAFNPLLGG